MKEKIHPPYQEVLFVDSSNGYKFRLKCISEVKNKN